MIVEHQTLSKSNIILFLKWTIEIAKANGLKIEKYLTHLFDMLSNSDVKAKRTLIDVMSWSEKIPEELKVSSGR